MVVESILGGLRYSYVGLLIALTLLGALPSLAEEAPDRRMVLTFDDLPSQRAQHQSQARIAEIMEGLVRTLTERADEGDSTRSHIPAIGFVNENKLEIDGDVDPGRVKLLERWLDACLELGNHSYSHPDLHHLPAEEPAKQAAFVNFQQDVLRGETVTRPLIESRDGKLRYFRHPFLHTGRDLETKQAFERFLTEHGYVVAPVTIDNSEWIFARAYTETLDRGDSKLQQKTATAYLDYMERMVEFYEGQSQALVGREIPQILLLHANALNAHHLEGLIARLEQRGYRFIDLQTALEDPVFGSADTYVGPSGITWLHRWAITRGVDRSVFQGEPVTPQWVQELAGIRE